MKNTYSALTLAAVSLSILLFSCQKEPGIPEPPKSKWLISKVIQENYSLGEIIESSSQRVYIYNEFNKPILCVDSSLFPSNNLYVDSFYYNNQQQLIRKAKFGFSNKLIKKLTSDDYSYDTNGRLVKRENYTLYVPTNTFEWTETSIYSYGGDSVSISTTHRFPDDRMQYTRVALKLDMIGNIVKEIRYNMDSSNNVINQFERSYEQYDNQPNPMFSFNLGAINLMEPFPDTYYKISTNNVGRIDEPDDVNFYERHDYVYNADGMVKDWAARNLNKGDSVAWAMQVYKFEYRKIDE